MNDDVENEALPKRRRGRGAILVLLFLLLLAGGGIAALVFYSPAGPLTQGLAWLVERKTGCSLAVAGAKSVRLWPEPSVHFENVTLSGPCAPGGAERAAAEAVDADLTWKELLTGDFNIVRLTIARPRLTVRGSDLVFLTTQQGTGSPQPLATLGNVETLSLTGGTLTYISEGGRKTNFDDISLQAVRETGGAAVAIDGGLKAVGEALVFSGNVAATGAAGAPVSFRIEGDPLTANVSGTLSGGADGGFSGTVKARTPSMRKLARWFGSESLENVPNLPATLDGSLKSARQRLDLDPVTLTAGDNRGQGRATLSLSGARPSVTSSLAFAKFDLDPMLPPPVQGLAAAAQTAPEIVVPSAWSSLASELERYVAGDTDAPTSAALGVATDAAAWSLTPYKLEDLFGQGIDVDLAVKADELRYRRFEMKNADIGLRSTKPGVDVVVNKVEYGGGVARGKLAIDTATTPARTSFKADLERFPVDDVLGELHERRYLSGAATGVIEVTARGASPRDLVTSLDGKLALTVANGSVIGYSLRDILVSLGQSHGYKPSARTRFSRLKTSYTIRKGVLRSTEDLQMTGGEIEAVARGTIGLVTGALKQTGQIKLTPPPLWLPIWLRIGGTLSKPDIGWSLFAHLAEPARFANPLAVSQSRDRMPADVRARIRAVLDADRKSSPVSEDLRRYLEDLLRNY